MDIESTNEQTLKLFKEHRKELLKDYYQKVFPFDRITKWLAYSDFASNSQYDSYFSRREISYNIASDYDEDEEFVIRHLCYDNADRFKADVLDKLPLRIDIGAVFDQQPRRNKDMVHKEKSIAMDREYVIDIDMSDYDRIRSCCTGKKLCHRCWRFMYLAYKVLKRSLEDDFGFRKILWVFSGRRGIHAWVGDERARIMRVDVRAALTQYLDISVSTDKADRMIHNHIRENVKQQGNDYEFEYPLFK